jgi:hypothetical protein
MTSQVTIYGWSTKQGCRRAVRRRPAATGADRFKDDVLAYAFKLADQPVLARP